jgi:hypothetical protein
VTARRAYRDWPDYGPRATDLGPLFQSGEAARDAVLQGFEDHKPRVVQALRDEAHRVYRRTGGPVSANDVRPVLDRFPGIDARILVAAFPLSEWQIVGETKHDAPGNHARRIRTYVPRVEV